MSKPIKARCNYRAGSKRRTIIARAEKIALGVEGVKGVRNDLQIKG